jgi:protocatechuate 3,4-dioxygenase beta subunit
MKKLDRRSFVKISMLGGIAGLYPVALSAEMIEKLLPTPEEIEGPFYPLIGVKDKDADLTQIAGKNGIARGKAIVLEGRVLDTDGNPIEEATIDLWQANAAGRYFHPHDPNTAAPLDPHFQGWAIVPSGKDGLFRFKTIFPGAYPAAPRWLRPPHIHFKIKKPGYAELVTQMYFPDNPLNNKDRFLNQKSDEEKRLMVAALSEATPETYVYNIVLQKTG